MHRRHAVNDALGEWQRFAPIQFINGTDVPGSKDAGNAERNNELTCSTGGQPFQGGEVQVIVVIMAEEHYINTREILPLHTRRTPAVRADPGERTGPRRPDRIRENVDSGLL